MGRLAKAAAVLAAVLVVSAACGESERATSAEAGTVVIPFDYDPTSPLPEIPPARFGAEPTIKILSPRLDQTVSGVFDVLIPVTSFNLDCDLMGKRPVAGYGHWDVSLDTDTPWAPCSGWVASR
jgi:hypothetical protein